MREPATRPEPARAGAHQPQERSRVGPMVGPLFLLQGLSALCSIVPTCHESIQNKGHHPHVLQGALHAASPHGSDAAKTSHGAAMRLHATRALALLLIFARSSHGSRSAAALHRLRGGSINPKLPLSSAPIIGFQQSSSPAWPHQQQQPPPQQQQAQLPSLYQQQQPAQSEAQGERTITDMKQARRSNRCARARLYPPSHAVYAAMRSSDRA